MAIFPVSILMIKSMTAYGRASDSFTFGKLVVEIHSVNRKMLDVTVYLPKELLRFDIDVRKWLASEIERGQITIRASMQSDGDATKNIHQQLVQLQQLHAGWSEVARTLGYDPQAAIDLTFLVNQLHSSPLIDTKEQELEYKNALQRVVHAALDELMHMKLEEGKALALDMENRLVSIEKQIKEIEKRKEEPLHRYRKKITERIEEMEAITPDLEERISRELIFLAERMDVTEELVRLHSHLDQFRKQLRADKAVGRTLEFLTQEMLRETNTLGAKSADGEVSQFVVMIKSELEKIREQVQNFE